VKEDQSIKIHSEDQKPLQKPVQHSKSVATSTLLQARSGHKKEVEFNWEGSTQPTHSSDSMISGIQSLKEGKMVKGTTTKKVVLPNDPKAHQQLSAARNSSTAISSWVEMQLKKLKSRKSSTCW